MENYEHHFSRDRIAQVAGVLGIDPVHLAPSLRLTRSHKWNVPGIRQLEGSLRGRMRLALQYLRIGRPEPAARRCEEVLAEIAGRQHPDEAVVALKMAALKDDLGLHREAIEILARYRDRGVFDNPGLREWAAYHTGIALRRLGDYDNAHYTLRPLTELAQEGNSRGSAWHQLGVIELCRFGGRDGMRKFDRVWEYFRRCYDEWRNDGASYRWAYPARRAGELCLKARQAWMAMDLFLQARQWADEFDHPGLAAQIEQELRATVSAAVPQDGARRLGNLGLLPASDRIGKQ